MKLDPNPLIRLNFHDLLNGAPLYFLSRKKKKKKFTTSLFPRENPRALFGYFQNKENRDKRSS